MTHERLNKYINDVQCTLPLWHDYINHQLTYKLRCLSC